AGGGPVLRRARLHKAPDRSRGAVSDDGRADRGNRTEDRRAAGGTVASTGPGGRNAGGSGVGVRGQVPATEDVEVSADDSAWASHDRGAKRTSRSIDAQGRRRSGVPE